jgi:hypothetical protein
MYDTSPCTKRGAGEIVTMGSMVTMDVIAASAGLESFLQAAPWEGQIAAVFDHSLLCTAPDEHLLHLHMGPHLASPFSLRIEDDFAKLLHAIPFVQGMPVRKMGLTIALTEDVHLSLFRTSYYQSPRHLSVDVVPEAIGHARHTLRLYGRVGGFDQLPAAQTIGSTMHQALAGGDAAQMLEATHQLIGLGSGLTPSGDDFLVGCLRGLWLIRSNAPGAGQTLDRLRDVLPPDLDARTTRVGAEFIRYALEGAFAEVLDRAALALLAPSQPQMVQAAITRLLAQGETSGTDTMLGLLTCLEALLSSPRRDPRHERQDAATTSTSSATIRGKVHADACLECDP